jgi:hypothetical protein
MPDIKRMMLNNTAKPRQSWREQMAIMTDWANKQSLWLERKKRLTDGR